MSKKVILGVVSTACLKFGFNPWPVRVVNVLFLFLFPISSIVSYFVIGGLMRLFK